MFGVMDISASGLVAQRVRMNTIAMNIANVDTVSGADGGPYKRRSVIFETGMDGRDRQERGVHVSSIRKEEVYRWEYDPSHPYANAEGYVKLPGISHLVEMVNGMEASRAYEANLAALAFSKTMMTSSLRLLA